MYECFHCGNKTVYWTGDFSFDDFGIEGEGIVQVCHCNTCHADIFYHITLTKEDEEEVMRNGSTT